MVSHLLLILVFLSHHNSKPSITINLSKKQCSSREGGVRKSKQNGSCPSWQKTRLTGYWQRVQCSHHTCVRMCMYAWLLWPTDKSVVSQISPYQYLSKHHHDIHRPSLHHTSITVSLHGSKSSANWRERTQVWGFVKYRSSCDVIIFRADAGNSLESLVEEFRDSTVYPILLNPFAVGFLYELKCISSSVVLQVNKLHCGSVITFYDNTSADSTDATVAVDICLTAFIIAKVNKVINFNISAVRIW